MKVTTKFGHTEGGFLHPMLLLVLLFSGLAFAGQSARISTAEISNDSVRAQPVNGACRLEWSFHDWDPNPQHMHPVSVPACGFDVQMFKGDYVVLQIYSMQNQGQNYGVCQIPLRLTPRFATIRYQRIPSGAGGVDTCEAWDIGGQRFFAQSKTYSRTEGTLENGTKLSGTGQDMSTAYLRLFSTTVPMGGRPPVTADRGDMLEWKLDGNTDDSSGNRLNGRRSNGSIAYIPTPGQDLVVAVIKMTDAPQWSRWISMRVGYPNQLDCSDSYSQADASAEVQCQWSLNGTPPSAPVWSDQSARQPTLTGIEFGTYDFRLKVTDATGSTVEDNLTVGAVAYDDNGVVIPADPRVTEIFGPMIAFGQNPWGYADERAQRAVELQNKYFQNSGLAPPSWETRGQGTVSYVFSGRGPYPGIPCTNLSTALTSASQVVEVKDASCLSLQSLPTWILIGNNWGSQEIVRICGASARQGPARLDVCFDGRGLSGANFNGSLTVAPQAWAMGTNVGEYRVEGQGTRFVSDSDRPICPAGAPGPPGPVLYADGAVSLTSGSKVITGNSTAWTTENKVIQGDYIRVDAMHDGMPFVYWSRIAAVRDGTHLDVDRPVPEGVDTRPASYKIVGYRYLALDFQDPSGAVHQLLKLTQGCESETAAFAISTQDIPEINAKMITGATFSSKDSLGAQSAFGANFYGSGMAARAFYFRSGWDFAKQTANIMDDYWARDPELGGGWSGGIPLLQGGGVIGAITDLATNPDTLLSWDDVRAFVKRGASAAQWGCNSTDTRDSGYLEAWVALSARYDPDPQYRRQWEDALAQTYQRDKACQHEDRSWSNGFIFNASNSPPLTLTNGSTTVRGSGLKPGLCFGVTSGSVTVTNGSSTISGPGLVKGAKIALTGTRDGKPFVGFYQFSLGASSDSAVISAVWLGDSGVAGYIVENNDFLTTIAQDNTDAQLSKNWACTYVAPTELQLNRPWDGPDTQRGHIYSYALAGYGQQPFMLGIKTTAMVWASHNSDSALGSQFASLAADAGEWIHDMGFDPVTQGLYYGRLFGACEPQTEPTRNPVFDYRTPNCNYGLNPSAIRAARVLTAETSQALRVYYEASPTADRKQWGDLAYGSIWGYCPYTKPGFYCDENYVRDEVSDGAMGSYKWPGFFFGMGMAHQWPAVRLEGSTGAPVARPPRRR